MSHRRFWTVAVLVITAVGVTHQDPERLPEPPRDPAVDTRLPPVQQPEFTAIERRDLLQEFGGPAPLAGFYRLFSYRDGSGGPIPATGFLVIGRRHLSIQLLGLRTGNPALQSGFRTYRVDGDQLVMTTMIGFGNNSEGKMAVERAGLSSRHRFRLIGTRLTMFMPFGRTLEFDRIE